MFAGAWECCGPGSWAPGEAALGLPLRKGAHPGAPMTLGGSSPISGTCANAAPSCSPLPGAGGRQQRQAGEGAPPTLPHPALQEVSWRLAPPQGLWVSVVPADATCSQTSGRDLRPALGQAALHPAKAPANTEATSAERGRARRTVGCPEHF